MAIPMLLLAGAGGLLGAMKAKRQQDQADAQNKYRKAALTYSPWTGMSDPGGASAPTMLEGALGGALTGAQLGGALNQLPGVGEGAAAAGEAGALKTTGGQNYLGLSQEALAGVQPQQQSFMSNTWAQFDPNKYPFLASK